MFKLTSRLSALSIQSTRRAITPSVRISYAPLYSSFSTSTFNFEEAKKPKPAKKVKKVKKVSPPAPKSKLQLRREAKPKRPATAFAHYVKDSFPNFPASDTRPAPEKVKELSLQWAGLSDSDKSKYQEIQKKLSDEYHLKLQKWAEEYPPRVTSYVKYIKAEFHNGATKPDGPESACARVSELAKRWNTLTPTEKAAYN